MIVCVPVTSSGQIDPRWGRSNRVAIVDVHQGSVVAWHEHEVGWGELHDSGTEGSHHARVARFLREHSVQTIVAHHMGEGMHQMVQEMGLQVRLGAVGDARAATIAAAG